MPIQAHDDIRDDADNLEHYVRGMKLGFEVSRTGMVEGRENVIGCMGELNQLTGALLKFGKHAEDCPANPPGPQRCLCGWEVLRHLCEERINVYEDIAEFLREH